MISGYQLPDIALVDAKPIQRVLYTIKLAKQYAFYAMHGSGGGQSNAGALRGSVRTVLCKAEAWQAKSVALPLIGAGQAKWPVEVAARLQIAEIIDFTKGGTRTSLQVGL